VATSLEPEHPVQQNPSSEHFHIHNKNQLKFHPMHSNKENLFPEKFRASDLAHVSSNHKMSSNSEKVESNYSEEDKEVFELIKNNGKLCLSFATLPSGDIT
jgi:hypothetical protein